MRKITISEIKEGMRNITVEGVVIKKSEAKIINTRFGPALFAYAIIEDETGRIRLNLWRRQVEIVRVGAKIRAVNAFVKEFGGNLELNVGRDGRIEVIE